MKSMRFELHSSKMNLETMVRAYSIFFKSILAIFWSQKIAILQVNQVMRMAAAQFYWLRIRFREVIISLSRIHKNLKTKTKKY